ncbi:MAG TPA: RNA polymerase sigma factor [Thermoanaerobaculia bacterium]|nr:RNA polymerase sigma factor [Thermoanaerobaculia bacterium]
MDPNDVELVQRVRSGDEDAFQQLVARHSRALFGIAWRITGNTADADDVVQEAFLRAYRRIETYDGRAGVATWLYRIAVNCSLDLIESRRRREAPLTAVDDLTRFSGEGASPERTAHAAEVQRAIDAALTQLSGNERTAFVLRHFEGVPLEEIGQILGTRLNATKNTIFRAVRKLREHLQPYTGSLV